AVGPAAVLHAHATLHLRPCGGHEKEQRRDGEHGGDAVKCRTLHDPKVGTAPNLSTTRAGRNVAARLSLSLVPSRSPQRLATFFWNEATCASLRCLRQLNEGEQLYASILPGYFAWIAAANLVASARSGFDVSNQSRSAYGA